MATKTYESGASKRKRQKLQEKAVHSSRTILKFSNPSSRSHDGAISRNESTVVHLSELMQTQTQQ